jgi:hypothetical protein
MKIFYININRIAKIWQKAGWGSQAPVLMVLRKPAPGGVTCLSI